MIDPFSTFISICLFLLRILDSRLVARGMYALMACLVIFTAVSIFMFIGVCRPLKAYWVVGVDGVCLSDRQIMGVIIAQGGK